MIALSDFAIEDRVRVPLGGVLRGERTTHTLMAIAYGAFLGYFIPLVWMDAHLATGFVCRPIPPMLRLCLTVMSAGVLFSGIPDLYAALGGFGGGWPWSAWH